MKNERTKCESKQNICKICICIWKVGTKQSQSCKHSNTIGNSFIAHNIFSVVWFAYEVGEWWRRHNENSKNNKNNEWRTMANGNPAYRGKSAIFVVAVLKIFSFENAWSCSGCCWYIFSFDLSLCINETHAFVHRRKRDETKEF